MARGLKVLLVGSGGREHALAWKLAQSPDLGALLVAPGNAGTAHLGENIPVEAEDIEGLVSLARERTVDLVVVGPEAPLVAGITDRLTAMGVHVFGPTRAAARIEGSKVFSKRLMAQAGIPTARFEVGESPEAARDCVRRWDGPMVVKADGLAAGKGAVVPETTDEALEAVEAMMVERRFGASVDRVVIEERLEGEEASIFALTDGERLAFFPPSQDHKRIFDHDEGTNTGGMGAYAPAPAVDDALLGRVEREVLRPVLEALADGGSPYRGVLYIGLMLTAEGPKVIEFNARFGDPEAQVLIPLVDEDLLPWLDAVAAGTLPDGPLAFSDDACTCVVMASGGYPGAYRTGEPIEGLADAEALEGVMVFHAGTAEQDGVTVTAGGRVLGVTARAETLEASISRAYDAVDRIHFADAHFRRDIGARALGRLERTP